MSELLNAELEGYRIYSLSKRYDNLNLWAKYAADHSGYCLEFANEGPLFEHAKEEGLVAGVGAVVTACQRVGIRSQVQRLSRPHRGDRRARRRRRRGGQLEGADNGEAAAAQTTTDAAEPDALMANGSEPAPEPAPAPKPESISPPAPSE